VNPVAISFDTQAPSHLQFNTRPSSPLLLLLPWSGGRQGPEAFRRLGDGWQ